MKFEGDQEFTQEPAVLWNKLRNAAYVVECIPDATPKGPQTRDQASCSVRPGFSFVRGTMDVTATVLEAVEPTLLKVGLVSKGIGSGSDVEATLNFAGHEKGTKVHWQAELKSMSGLMKLVPAGLIKGAAQQVIEEVLANVRKKISPAGQG